MCNRPRVDTPRDAEFGHKRGHGVYFCTVIQSVHRKAQELLNLSALAPKDYIFQLDKVSKRMFDRFFDRAADMEYDAGMWERFYADQSPFY